MSHKAVTFLPCPFCGEEPEVETMGSCIDIDCCCSMSLQKCDMLTRDERNSWSNETYKYSDAAELKALTYMASVWNGRVK
jgi:hypothetical protein